MKRLEWFCGVFGACTGLLITAGIKAHFDELSRELVVLRASNEELKRQLATTLVQRETAVKKASTESSDAASNNAAAAELAKATSSHLESAIAVHGQWRWNLLVHELLQPFPRITQRMHDAAVRTCFDNGTMYCLRAQIVGGRLYITDYRAIFFDRYYAPSRVMPLLETLRRHPNLPDVRK